jgi:DNA-binding transcriptional regulator YdaS (Cro superfamily)
MTLSEYFQTLPRGAKTTMCKELAITRTWLSLICSGRRRPSPMLSIAIDKYTRGAVTTRDLRPDLFKK